MQNLMHNCWYRLAVPEEWFKATHQTFFISLNSSSALVRKNEFYQLTVSVFLSLKMYYLVVHWLRFCTSTAGGADSVPGWENKILHTTSSVCKP